MSSPGRSFLLLSMLTLFAAAFTATGARPQTPQVAMPAGPSVLADKELAAVVPAGFFYSGRSAPTQARNSAAARLPRNRYVLAGLVDTSGYSADVRETYQGFFIADTRVTVGAGTLGAGAYGFGFTDDGNFTVTDVGGNKLLAVPSAQDAAQTRPRPLMMTVSGGKLRLYGGRRYVEIGAAPVEPEL